jgi:uncharacterized protein YdiU (UPF0061 family)
MAFQPQATILDLGEGYYDPVEPARFPQTILRFRNDRAAAEVGLDRIPDEEWITRFARFEPFAGSLPQPLALRYHGHQFRVYNPDIGDGRGFLYAQCRDDRGRLMDFGTKGSGQTPYSRFGDGRLTLKGGVREILATEMLEALGVHPSRTLSLIETGEALERGDEPSPTRSAVLVRLSHSHIRIGAFQRLAYEQDAERMARLVDYVLIHLHDEQPGPEPAVQLLRNVVARTARLAGSYMAAGFVHGVLNTDNINVTGESFDYGPWRFAPTWDPGFTAAYFDHQGLYAFGRQPEAIHWNCGQLAVALRPLVPAEPLIEALETFTPLYQAAVADRFLWRLGIVPRGVEQDLGVIQASERGLRATGLGLDEFFFAGFGGRAPEGEAWDELRAALAPYQPRKPRDHAYWSGAPCSMLIDEVEALWSAIDERDDWAPLHAKIAAIRDMGAALA